MRNREPAAVRAVGELDDRPVPGVHVGRLDASPGSRVEQEDVAGGVAGGQRAPVRAQRQRRHPLSHAAHDADGRRALVQRGEQAAARLRAVVERDALAGEQQRAVEVVLGERARAEPLRVGAGGLVARGAALLEREEPGDDREDEQPGDSGEHGAQAPLGAPARRAALVEEGPLDVSQLGVVGGRPVERGGQPRAAVELAGVAAARVPLARRDAEVVVQAPALDVLLEPFAQARPLAQQGLVGDLRLLAADGHEPAVGQRGEHLRGARRALELGERDAPAHGGVALADPGQPHEDRPRARLLLPARGRRRRARPAARPRRGRRPRGRRREREALAVALLPQLEQRGREQRQRTGLAPDVGDQRVDERGVGAQARALRGGLDRAPQLVAAHRADRHVAGAQHPPQLGVARAAPVEVGAQGDQDDRAAARVAHGGDERVGERGALVLVAAGGEELLELVDGDHEPALGRGLCDRLPERAARVRARAHDARPPSPRCRGARRRRAPAAGRP